METLLLSEAQKNYQLVNEDLLDDCILTLISGTDDEKLSIASDYSEEGLILPHDVLDFLLDDLISNVIEIPLKSSLQYIQEIISTAPYDSRATYIEILLRKVRDKIILIDRNAIHDQALLIRLELIDQFIKNQLFPSIEPSLKSDFKVSQLVELADFLFYGTSLKKKYKRVFIYRFLGRAFGINTSDDSYKNTSANNMNREKNKLLFIKSLKREFEKETNGGIPISLD
jgi:hypothetical protein